jgi:F-box protein 9
MEDSNPDLETFRQQWRAEVEGKNKVDGNTRKSKPGSNKQHARRQAFDDLPSQKGSRADDHEGHHESQNAGRRLSSNRRVVDPKLENDGGSSRQHSSTEEPKSALEHYEKAVERETQGKLGDSLDLYRKAFKVTYPSALFWEMLMLGTA